METRDRKGRGDRRRRGGEEDGKKKKERSEICVSMCSQWVPLESDEKKLFDRYQYVYVCPNTSSYDVSGGGARTSSSVGAQICYPYHFHVNYCNYGPDNVHCMQTL